MCGMESGGITQGHVFFRRIALGGRPPSGADGQERTLDPLGWTSTSYLI